MKYDKPPVIPIKGMNIKNRIIDENEGVDQFNIAINLEQLIEDLKSYTDARGWVNIQICKRKTPSPKGHTHYPRIASKVNDQHKADNEIENAA